MYVLLVAMRIRMDHGWRHGKWNHLKEVFSHNDTLRNQEKLE